MRPWQPSSSFNIPEAPSWIVSVVGRPEDFRNGLERPRGNGLLRGRIRAGRQLKIWGSATTLVSSRSANASRRKKCARGHVDRGWIARIRRDSLCDPSRPYGPGSHVPRYPFAGRRRVLGDLLIALVAAYGVIIPIRLAWRKATRGLERVMLALVDHRAGGARRELGRALPCSAGCLGGSASRSSSVARSYSLPEALSRGLQIGLPVAAIMAAVYPVLGMSWYFDTENWAAGAWDSWAESRTDIWREAMVKAVTGRGWPRGSRRFRR